VKKQTRDRLVLPILLPVGILVVIVAALYGFSRILLSISHNAATATALAVALAIVVVSAIVAGRRIVRPSSFAGLVGAVTGVAMIAGGIALATVDTEGEGGQGEGGKDRRNEDSRSRAQSVSRVLQKVASHPAPARGPIPTGAVARLGMTSHPVGTVWPDAANEPSPVPQ